MPVRLIRAALGRVPRLAHLRVILFFWPIRASSWNQISILPTSIAFSRATSSRRAGKFFKILDGSLGLCIRWRGRAESLR